MVAFSSLLGFRQPFIPIFFRITNQSLYLLGHYLHGKPTSTRPRHRWNRPPSWRKHSIVLIPVFATIPGYLCRMVGYRSPITTLESWHFGKLDFRIFEFLNFWIFESWHFGKLEFSNFWIFEFLKFWIFEFLNFWIIEFLNFWIFEFLNFWIFEFFNISYTWIFQILIFEKFKYEFYKILNFWICQDFEYFKILNF